MYDIGDRERSKAGSKSRQWDEEGQLGSSEELLSRSWVVCGASFKIVLVHVALTLCEPMVNHRRMVWRVECGDVENGQFLPLPSLDGGCRGSTRYISIFKVQSYLGPIASTILAAAWRVPSHDMLQVHAEP